MKEEDMKKLRCCGPHPYNTGVMSKFKPDDGTFTYLCSGSLCAGWVWEELDNDTARMMSSVAVEAIMKQPKEDGYCGLIKK